VTDSAGFSARKLRGAESFGKVLDGDNARALIPAVALRSTDETIDVNARRRILHLNRIQVLARPFASGAPALK